MMFSVFNDPRQILHVPQVAGETNQTSGTWQAATQPVSVPIKGDIQEITARELQRLPEGEYEIGDCRFFTSAVLADGDLLQVTEGDGSVTVWTVNTLEKKLRFMPKFGIPSRRAYLLKRRA